MKTYTLNGKEYTSLWQIRNENQNLIFSNEVTDELLSRIGITTKDVPDPEPQQPDPLVMAKNTRSMEVQRIVVVVDEMLFDGNENAQQRMLMKIQTWNTSDKTTKWVLADNIVADVTKDQLTKALQESVKEMNKIWLTPYNK